MRVSDVELLIAGLRIERIDTPECLGAENFNGFNLLMHLCFTPPIDSFCFVTHKIRAQGYQHYVEVRDDWSIELAGSVSS
jgi:hypothetical protein